jgi:DNA repair protein RadD
MKTLRPYQKDALDKLIYQVENSTDPCIVNASVGAGKSLIIAELLLYLQNRNKNVLCLTMNSDLISQNAATYEGQGGRCGIYCATLKKKEYDYPVIFASPGSIVKAIQKERTISRKEFDLIVVDECHNIDVKKPTSMYMRIFNHYGCYVVGLTGTPFRGKESIIGDKAFFKSEVCNISTSWLVKNNYLVMPVYGHHDKSDIDFSNVKITNGQFNKKDLNRVVEDNLTLTHEIMREVHGLVSQRRGAFIFATSIKHCYECASQLPEERTRIITGKTCPKERKESLELARKGQICYLISVNCLTTGVDVPLFDTVVFVRPTESITLYLQALGRGLRLHDEKLNCLVLDYAGNLERHGDIDDLIVNEMRLEKAKNDPDFCIPCPECDTNNTMHARRCIGLSDNKRCSYMFDWKNCPDCWYENDITAKNCKNCDYQLIDPNTGLSKSCSKDHEVFNVLKANFRISPQNHNGYPIYELEFQLEDGISFTQNYFTGTDASYKYTYFNLFKKLVPKASYLYKHLHNTNAVIAYLKQHGIDRPKKIVCKNSKWGLQVVDYIMPEDPTL